MCMIKFGYLAKLSVPGRAQMMRKNAKHVALNIAMCGFVRAVQGSLISISKDPSIYDLQLRVNILVPL